MSMKEAMRSLTQEIIGSYEARAAGITSLRKEVTAQRQATQKAHQAMARQQRADLAKGRYELAGSVANKLKELDTAHQAMARQQHADLAKGRSYLTQAEAQRKSEVNAWMKDVATAHAEAQDEWQKLTGTMQAKRGVLVVERPPEAVEEAPAEVTPEFTALRHRVFVYLADHPDGTRMTELEREFGVGRIQMARVIRSLMDESKVKKQDLLYFAI